MRLETFRARKLGALDDFSIDLRKLPGPLVAVTGPNGAGKSTFLELFGPGAFYRKTPTRGTLVNLATARDAVLEVGAVNGKAWTFRHLVDCVSGKSEALILDADGAPVLADTKVKSFDGWAAKHLPAPEVLLGCMFTAQNAGGFLAAKASERKATLLRVLGVERLEALCKRARDRVSGASHTHSLAMQRLADERAKSGDVTALEAEVERTRSEAAAADEALAQARAALEAGKVERARLDELGREGERRRARRLELSTAIGAAEKEEADTGERLTNNRAVLADADAIRKAVADVERLGGELAASRTAAQQAADDAVRAHREGTDLDQRLRAIEVRLERSDELLAGREAIAAAEASLPGLEQAAREADGALGVCQDAFDDLQGQHVAGFEERIKPLRKAVDDIRDCEDGADDARARLASVASLAGRTADADDAAIKLAAELPAQTKAAGDALKAARDRKAVADRKLADARAIAARQSAITAAEQDQAAGVAERAELEPRRDKAFTDKRTAEQLAGDHRTRVTEREQELAAAKVLAAKAEPLAKAEARIVELERALEGIRGRLGALRAELAAAPAPVPVPENGPMVGALDGAVQSAELAARAAHGIVAGAGVRLEAARAASVRLVELEAARTQAEVELADWKRLADDLGRDGLQAAEIDAAGPELTALVNDLLHSCHGPRFTVRVETQRLSADGKDMLEGCSVIVLDTQPPGGGHGREAEGETFSGGERVIIGEALSLALTMLACRRAGLEGITLVRDESGAALDPANARVYIAMLRRAAELVRADKVLFVSHVPEVWDLADSRIEVGG